MKRGIKNLLILIIVGLVIGLSVVYYVFNKPHRDIEGETPYAKMEAKALFSEYNENEEEANLKYGDKVIQVTGKIVEIAKDKNDVSFVLNDEMEGVNCSLDSLMVLNSKDLINTYKIGNNITLKGKCDGFDMIMGVVLTQCFIVK